jgi:hypothetical protein
MKLLGKVWSYHDIIIEILPKQERLLMVLLRLVKRSLENNVVANGKE